METATLLSHNTHVSASPIPEGNSPLHANDHRILLDQVERILHSEELRTSEVLRRLLRFLAEKSALGEADELKEYVVAIEGLGKPASYDPRHNSGVRIQVGRLRQKLADYYRTEGVDDPIIVDIPKGRFKLKYEIRDSCAPPAHGAAISADPEPLEIPRRNTLAGKLGRMHMAIPFAAGVLVALGIVSVYNASVRAPAKGAISAHSAAWNAEMEELWRPFVATGRPTILTIEDPLFIELDGKKGVYYRDKTLNTWHDVTSSPAIGALRAALDNREIAPSRYYTAFGEVDASFLLAGLLGSRVQNLAVLKTSDLSMRDLADNNVIFVGIENIFFTKIRVAPIDAPLEPVHEGIRNVHPGPHEPALFVDQYSTAPTEQGLAYALVTHVPGPLGGNDIESFTSSRSAGYVAAVKAFSDPPFVKTIVRELKQAAGGELPRYYQVLLKVKFTAEEPTEITFVLARALNYPAKP